MHVYVDDQRDPKKHLSKKESENIVLIRDAEEAIKFFKDNASQLEIVHLDYHLGHYYFTGQTLFEYLLCLSDDENTPNLKTIYLHSSDAEKSQEMIDTFGEMFEDNGISVIKNSCEQ